MGIVLQLEAGVPALWKSANHAGFHEDDRQTDPHCPCGVGAVQRLLAECGANPGHSKKG